MDFTIFYSWQSDLDSKLNRNFIETAIRKASKKVSKNDSIAFDMVVDRDTIGIPGSPSIVESITGKIAKSDLFICDVSIVNRGINGKTSPNPNVLFELGFASAVLGWDRIIMVQNTSFGGPEKLPFDLRGRRIVQYKLESSNLDKKKAEEKALEGIFINALNYYHTEYNIKQKAIWWGTWELKTTVKYFSSILNIFRVSSDAFYFNMFLVDGSRTGDVQGKAKILTPHIALAKLQIDDNVFAHFTFRRQISEDSWYIEVEEDENGQNFHGMGTSFNGKYIQKSETLVLHELLDEIDLNEIKRITGDYTDSLLENIQRIGISKEENSNIRSISGYVKGMSSSLESFIILNDVGDVWCAFLDPYQEGIVRYFTNKYNDSDKSRPKEMSEWLRNRIGATIVINEINKDVEM